MESRYKDTELIEQLLACELSPYARQFVLSLRSWIRDRALTESQSTALRKIQLTYSTGTMKAENTIKHEWTQACTAEQYAEAKICASYYINNPPYFNDLAFRILNHENYIPTRDEYDKLVNNKYAQRVLEEHSSACKFERGSLVLLRKPAISRLSLHEFESVPLLVIKEHAAPIICSASGAKRYMVVPVGKGEPFIVEERHIKKYIKTY